MAAACGASRSGQYTVPRIEEPIKGHGGDFDVQDIILTISSNGLFGTVGSL